MDDNDTLALLRSKHNKIVTCYVASWAVYRPNNGKFGIDNIRPELCTHLIYTFAGLNDTTWTIRSLDPDLDIRNNIGNYRRMTQLRQKYPELKVLLAIGGWNEGSKNYSILASSLERRTTFVNSVVDFLGTYNFNGLDLDWEYPGSRGGVPADKENFVSLVKELKEAFRPSKYLLTAAISANKDAIDVAYDIPELSKYLDHIHVMAYDYHGTWDQKVLPNAPLRSQDGHSVEESLNYLLRKGAPPSKLVLGLPMYGRTFVLKNKLNSSEESPINQATLTDGFKGPYTGQNGFMGYNEICEELVDHPENWKIGWDDNSQTPYVINGDRAIVFDNPKSLKAKVEYAMKLNLSGVMGWSIDTDDFNGKCASLTNSLDVKDNTFPLMKSINVVLTSSSSTDDNDDNNNNDNNNNNNNNNNNSSAEKYSYSFALITLALFAHYV
ncbi:PREDICTED: probable chitinase 2 [Habropoda laboriosa]|uniref:probable chitinase 2 n=1 Tax=Habropoda laboriosa TaxID=597456 RepID=UPI00083E6B4B|nr:PREDICTED: probable chitinase 2 [Habropoda laboriosa]